VLPRLRVLANKNSVWLRLSRSRMRGVGQGHTLGDTATRYSLSLFSARSCPSRFT
jgi:hypothetical protein